MTLNRIKTFLKLQLYNSKIDFTVKYILVKHVLKEKLQKVFNILYSVWKKTFKPFHQLSCFEGHPVVVCELTLQKTRLQPKHWLEFIFKFAYAYDFFNQISRFFMIRFNNISLYTHQKVKKYSLKRR